MKVKYLLIKLNYTKHMKYLMIIAYILVSCSTKSTNNSTKNDEQNLIVIDVTKKHPEKNCVRSRYRRYRVYTIRN